MTPFRTPPTVNTSLSHIFTPVHHLPHLSTPLGILHGPWTGEGEGDRFLGHNGHHSLRDAVSHPRRPESPVTPLHKPQNFTTYCPITLWSLLATQAVGGGYHNWTNIRSLNNVPTVTQIKYAVTAEPCVIHLRYRYHYCPTLQHLPHLSTNLNILSRYKTRHLHSWPASNFHILTTAVSHDGHVCAPLCSKLRILQKEHHLML